MILDNTKKIRFCVRCIMNSTVKGIMFDKKGICNFCHMQDKLQKMYSVNEKSDQVLRRITKNIQKSGKGKDYDCIVGVSGGRDTSYCLYYVKERLNLRPLAVHFDNGWDSIIAKENLRKLCNKLRVQLYEVGMDWKESCDLNKSTIRACVPYLDVTNDMGIASTLFRTASQKNIKYIILSHSFREEGIVPLLWNYIDGRFVKAIIKRFGTINYRHFKNVFLHNMLYWLFIKKIRIFNITNYYDDTGSDIDILLEKRFEWLNPAKTFTDKARFEHHMDNEFFVLVYYYAKHKFGFDWRIVDLSAKIRTGILTRQQALKIISYPGFFENIELVKHCLDKLEFSSEEFKSILKAPNKYFYDYPSYYPFLKFCRHIVLLLSRFNVLPSYTYEKFYKTI